MNNKFVDVESVKTLEDYLMQLGIFAVSLQGLNRLQDVAIRSGILDEDEIENAKTIMHQIHRLVVVMNDQIRMACFRSPVPWEEILVRITENIKSQMKKTDTPSISKIKKKSKK